MVASCNECRQFYNKSRESFAYQWQDELQLQEEIKKLAAERQEFITKARQEYMTSAELAPGCRCFDVQPSTNR